MQALLLIGLLESIVGCAEEVPVDTAGGFNEDGEYSGVELGVEADAKSTVTKTYYVSNPYSAANDYSGCSNGLKLTGSGSKITSVKPSGGGVSWDTLTSAGTSTLYDTWYCKGSTCDKDYTSGVCFYLGTVTVKVTGTTVSSLKYYFTDCSCDHD